MTLRSKRVAVLFGGGLVVFAILIFLFNSKGSSGGTLDKYFSLVKKGDASTSYAYFSPNHQKNLSKSSWADLIKQLQPKLQNSDIKLQESTVSTTNKDMKYEYYNIKQSSAEYVYSFVLVKTNGKWLIDSSLLRDASQAHIDNPGEAAVKE